MSLDANVCSADVKQVESLTKVRIQTSDSSPHILPTPCNGTESGHVGLGGISTLLLRKGFGKAAEGEVHDGTLFGVEGDVLAVVGIVALFGP